ncbi:MAG: hypothetical protein LBT48_07230 [Prevotellaceae bacterium]|jgi:predicted transporter|nr:hypothetical protein [Prevotellaceae bacterium]
MKTTKKPSNKRAIVSVGMLILFILLILSAITLEVMEELPNFSALETAYHVCTAVHVLLGLLLAGFGTFHIVYNWSALKRYIKNGEKK